MRPSRSKKVLGGVEKGLTKLRWEILSKEKEENSDRNENRCENNDDTERIADTNNNRNNNRNDKVMVQAFK